MTMPILGALVVAFCTPSRFNLLIAVLNRSPESNTVCVIFNVFVAV
jgi:hypothetical protein